jgi:hypothetical protein
MMAQLGRLGTPWGPSARHRNLRTPKPELSWITKEVQLMRIQRRLTTHCCRSPDDVGWTAVDPFRTFGPATPGFLECVLCGAVIALHRPAPQMRSEPDRPPMPRRQKAAAGRGADNGVGGVLPTSGRV